MFQLYLAFNRNFKLILIKFIGLRTNIKGPAVCVLTCVTSVFQVGPRRLPSGADRRVTPGRRLTSREDRLPGGPHECRAARPDRSQIGTWKAHVFPEVLKSQLKSGFLRKMWLMWEDSRNGKKHLGRQNNHLGPSQCLAGQSIFRSGMNCNAKKCN